MSMTRPPYASVFREQLVELVRSGCPPEELGEEFEPSAESIRNWVGQADHDEGRSHDGLTSAEREVLRWLGREKRRLLHGREILTKSRLVRLGNRLDLVQVFEFVRANRAMLAIGNRLADAGHTKSPV